MTMRFKMTVRRHTSAVTDGPFTETKELIGGYAFIRADSTDQAIRLGEALLGIAEPSKEFCVEVRELPEA
jgi:hypothetical protein